MAVASKKITVATKSEKIVAKKVTTAAKPVKTVKAPAATVEKTAAKPSKKATSFKGSFDVSFTYFDETPGTFKFAEVGADGKKLDMKTDKDKIVIGTLYVKKAKFGGVAPKSLKITVTVE